MLQNQTFLAISAAALAVAPKVLQDYVDEYFTSASIFGSRYLVGFRVLGHPNKKGTGIAPGNVAQTGFEFSEQVQKNRAILEAIEKLVADYPRGCFYLSIDWADGEAPVAFPRTGSGGGITN